MAPYQAYRFFYGNGLPGTFAQEGGRFVVFHTDFRVWLKYQYLQRQNMLTGNELFMACVDLCCKKHCSDMGFVGEALIWFHSCADVERLSLLPPLNERARVFMESQESEFSSYWDFYQIWASFKKQHGIDLYTCGEMHWWEFKRLFAELKEETPLMELRKLRTIKEAEVTGDDKKLAALRKQQWDKVKFEKRLAALPE